MEENKMNKKKLLVAALALSTVGVLSTIDTAGVLPFSAQTVQADDGDSFKKLEMLIKVDVVNEDRLNLKISKNPLFGGKPTTNFGDIITLIVSADSNNTVLSSADLVGNESANGLEISSAIFTSVADGDYYIAFKNSANNSILALSQNAFTVKNGKFVKKGGNSTNQATSSTSTTSGNNGWSGSSYYQNGTKVTSKWIFDKNYNSYFYLDASGNYVQNAWVGNYYLKSGGYMAKSEWIYDSNYKSYYYLTSEGSYARNAWAGSYYLKSDGKMAKGEWVYDKNYGAYYYLTSEGSYARNKWVGDYYLKSDGKMAVNERTPDGYQVDGSGKWIR